VEDKESLETGALISQLSDSVQNQIDDFFSDGVVTTSVVVSGILLSGDELFRVEQLSVSSSSYFINDGRLQINKDSAGHVLSGSGFAEKGVEGIISTSDGLVTWHLTIRLNTMLKAIQLPTGITDLNTGLSNVY
jgi:hypothetical protein